MISCLVLHNGGSEALGSLVSKLMHSLGPYYLFLIPVRPNFYGPPEQILAHHKHVNCMYSMHILIVMTPRPLPSLKS